MIDSGHKPSLMRPKKFCPYCGGGLMRTADKGGNRPFCAQCQEIFYENPVPSTCMILTNSQNHILLVKRKAPPQIGRWCLPGGFIELEETPELGALRELQEETGLSGRIDRLIGLVTTPSDRYGSILLICYRIDPWQGTPKAGDDASDIGFFPSTQLPDIAFPSHASFIRLYFATYSI